MATVLLEAVGPNLQSHPRGACVLFRGVPFLVSIAESANFFFAVSISIAWLRFLICFRGFHLHFVFSSFSFFVG